MEVPVLKVYDQKLDQLKKACEMARFELTVLERKEELLPLLDQLILPGQSCSVGGSMTLQTTGVLDYLEKRKDLCYLDRYHSEDPQAIFRQAFSCDVYLTSTNALTMKAELYNVDGSGNRVAAMIFGPKKVLVVLGINKLVSTLEEAEDRVRFLAAPANNVRLKKENPCTLTGKCMDCRMASRICCSAVTISQSIIKNRIHLIVIKEPLGY